MRLSSLYIPQPCQYFRAAEVESHAPLWQRLLDLGDRLRDRGENLTAFRRSLAGHDRVPYTDEEVDISVILFEAEKAVQDWTERRELLHQPTRESEYKALMVAVLQLRAATLRIQDGVMGDREAIRREAKSSGLARDVYEMIDEFEFQVSVLVEERDGVQPDWEVVRGEFLRKMENGDLVIDPIYGMQEVGDALVSIGPSTRIASISRPVESLVDIIEHRCPICLDNFGTTQQAVRLACGHLVDADCMESWVNSLAGQCNTCVLCRTELFPRRRREPSDVIRRYQELESRVRSLDTQINIARLDSKELAELLHEMQPNFIGQSLGR
jgi:hypothetical protein